VENLKELIQAFKNFRTAANTLVEELIKAEYCAGEDYPEKEPSFDELVCDLSGWVWTQVNILEGISLNKWFVIEVNSDNGLRVGIDQDPEGFKIIAGPMTEDEATQYCREYVAKEGIQEFNNAVDMAID